jgi:hypothetical protein
VTDQPKESRCSRIDLRRKRWLRGQTRQRPGG